MPKLLASLLLLMAACSGGSSASTCEGYGDKMKAGLAYAGKGDDFGPMVEAAVTSCKEDGWSQEAIDCFTAPRRGQGHKVCDAKLTPEQVKKRDDRAGKALMAMPKP
ncbi:MAG: hypothetical protein K8W52_07370 [Deltaproteobacteria bacterium]|nr:hypothetical protein [Deltaproteobacteria bacterium]